MATTGQHFEIEGHHLHYPTDFRDGRSAQGLFVVNANVADELIADSGFKVARVAPGKAILSLNCVDYIDTDCGTYLETAETFFIEPPGTTKATLPYVGTWQDIVGGNVASYAWALQVDTVLSQQAGIQMWGFPKTVEHLELDIEDGWVWFRLQMQGRDVFRYGVPCKGSKTPPALATPVYSVLQGRPHVGILNQQYRDSGYHFRGGRLELGNHPLADQLRDLAVGRKPLLGVWSGHLEFQMSAPVAL